jgi:hypothetical protein
VPTPFTGTPTYEANIAPLIGPKCGVCHNATTLAGGMDLTTYAGLMKGGKDGVVIVSGDSAGSLLIHIQSSQHFANLSAEELDLFKKWIDAGAPEQ